MIIDLDECKFLSRTTGGLNRITTSWIGQAENYQMICQINHERKRILSRSVHQSLRVLASFRMSYSAFRIWSLSILVGGLAGVHPVIVHVYWFREEIYGCLEVLQTNATRYPGRIRTFVSAKYKLKIQSQKSRSIVHHLHFDLATLLVVAERTVELLVQGHDGLLLCWRLPLRFAASHFASFVYVFTNCHFDKQNVCFCTRWRLPIIIYFRQHTLTQPHKLQYIPNRKSAPGRSVAVRFNSWYDYKISSDNKCDSRGVVLWERTIPFMWKLNKYSGSWCFSVLVLNWCVLAAA